MTNFIPGFHDRPWQEGPPDAWLAFYAHFEVATGRYTQDDRR